MMAKLDLHRKTEVKEQLTEHLYAIIQQNELRKAEKLQQLMLQLQLHAAERKEDRDAAAADPEAPACCRADAEGEGTEGEESGKGGGARLPAETRQEWLEKCVLRESVSS